MRAIFARKSRVLFLCICTHKDLAAPRVVLSRSRSVLCRRCLCMVYGRSGGPYRVKLMEQENPRQSFTGDRGQRVLLMDHTNIISYFELCKSREPPGLLTNVRNMVRHGRILSGHLMHFVTPSSSAPTGGAGRAAYRRQRQTNRTIFARFQPFCLSIYQTNRTIAHRKAGRH